MATKRSTLLGCTYPTNADTYLITWYALTSTTKERKDKSTPFSNHNKSLPRQQPQSSGTTKGNEGVNTVYLVVAQQFSGWCHSCSAAQVPQLDDWRHVVLTGNHQQCGQSWVPLHGRASAQSPVYALCIVRAILFLVIIWLFLVRFIVGSQCLCCPACDELDMCTASCDFLQQSGVSIPMRSIDMTVLTHM